MEALSILMETQVHAKIMHWVKKAGKFEVSGFGKVIPQNGVLYVVDAILLEQINQTGHTEINSVALAKAMYHLRDTPGHLNFWWHSHGYGHTYFSPTDIATIRQLGGNGFLAATVFNVAGAHHSGFYSSKPFPIFVESIPFERFSLPDELSVIEWDVSYDANVTNVRHPTKKEKRLRRMGLLKSRDEKLKDWIVDDDISERVKTSNNTSDEVLQDDVIDISALLKDSGGNGVYND